MINYIKADFYRIFFKKGMYIYFVSLFLLYLLFVFTKIMNITESNILSHAAIVSMFVLILGGGYLFATVYNDDLNAKSLPSLIGFGRKRTAIIISKVIINMIMATLIFSLAFITFCLLLVLLNFKLDANMILEIIKLMFDGLLKYLAFSSIASVATYGMQKATVSIVIYFLLATNFISQLLIMLLGQVEHVFGDLTKYTITPIVNDLIAKMSLSTILPYLIYVIIFVFLSILAFRNKDLEF